RPPADAKPAPPTSGRDFTESVVPSPPVAGQPVIPPPERGQTRSTGQEDPLRPTEQTERPRPLDSSERPAPRDPGTLQVESRPRGARVFLDGRLVGTTPLRLADVRAGEHAVRIDLSGYRPWVTSVNVAAGSRQRVAASLER
ncbi:MAG: PEGA domain-containing protein, partial [Vicinamibacterales bacterium]